MRMARPTNKQERGLLMGLTQKSLTFWRLSPAQRMTLVWSPVADALNSTMVKANDKATNVTMRAPPSVTYHYSVRIAGSSVYKLFKIKPEVWLRVRRIPGRFDTDSYTVVDLSVTPPITSESFILQNYPMRVVTMDGCTCISVVAIDSTVENVRQACFSIFRLQQLQKELSII